MPLGLEPHRAGGELVSWLYPSASGAAGEWTFQFVKPGSCLLDIVLIQFDVTYLVEGTIVGDRIEGMIQYDFGLFQLPIFWTGSLGDDALDGVFAGTISILGSEALAGGTLRARRVTQYVDPM